jgi:hypothetical protein
VEATTGHPGIAWAKGQSALVPESLILGESTSPFRPVFVPRRGSVQRVQDVPVNATALGELERLYREQGDRIWGAILAYAGDPEVANVMRSPIGLLVAASPSMWISVGVIHRRGVSAEEEVG